ncbi:MAG: hypothetical protein IMZ71_02620 [Chloroflexi bacterium]|nr:hypothetical protein [Chloroflexota bacterium]
MAKAKFQAKWTSAWRKEYGLPKGFVAFKVDERYWLPLGRALGALGKKQQEKGELVSLDVTLDIHYARRSLSQNALQWSLYDVTVLVMNGGIADPEKAWTPEKLYEQDMLDFAPTFPLTTKASVVADLREMVSIRRVTPIEGTGGEMVVCDIIVTSSHWTTVRMAEHIEMLFNRLASMGTNVQTSADILKFYMDWQDHLDKEKIVLHDEVVSQAEYKALHPTCEATGEFIGPTQGAPHGSGELHHISTRGSGVTMLPEKAKASDWLHLSKSAHAVWEQPDGGVEAFLKLAPHLTFKVRRVLKQLPAEESGAKETKIGDGQGVLQLAGAEQKTVYDDRLP